MIDPFAVQPLALENRRLIVGAWNDQMAARAPASCCCNEKRAASCTGTTAAMGHVFSRVQAVTERFLREVRVSSSRVIRWRVSQFLLEVGRVPRLHWNAMPKTVGP